MQVFYSDIFELDLPAGHRFPMEKYGQLRQRVAESVRGLRFRLPEAASDEELRLVHDSVYLERVLSGSLPREEQKRIGFPWSESLVERSRRSCGATVMAARSACEEGVALSLAGGTHHAFADHGEGYCLFNDSVVTARVLRNERLVSRVLVIDCDVHQGNGTAALSRDDDELFAYSIHGEHNYPFRKEAGDLDVALPDKTSDAEYLASLESSLPSIVEQFEPDLAIFLAGADPLGTDRLGRLALTRDGLARRDELVLGWCRDARVPVAITMAGGYSEPIEETVAAQTRTVATAARFHQEWRVKSVPSAHE